MVLSSLPFNLAIGGYTFSKLAATACEKIASWHQHYRTNELRCGTIIVWCGGNDVYGGRGLAEEDIKQTIRACGEEMVLVLGPTPRVKGRVHDYSSEKWSKTRAFHAESKMASVISRFDNASLVRHLGRQLCAGGLHKLGVRQGMFSADGVHLSAAGYRRVFVRVTASVPWLRTNA